MASSVLTVFLLLLLAVISHQSQSASAARQLADSPAGADQTPVFRYHNGPLLAGKVSINLIWYGKFTTSQRTIISDFIASLSSPPPPPNNAKTAPPSVAKWWNQINGYYNQIPNSPKKPSALSVQLGSQILHESYSLGKSLTSQHIEHLASTPGARRDAISVVLTAADVSVQGFCSSTCGKHGSSISKAATNGGKAVEKFAYIWAGNSETQCPGRCAWPFHQPIYGAQSPPLVAPNNDVGVDGMVTNLATLLAGTVTNPFGNGYFQGPAEAPLEAATACPGIYGAGAYPGYAGNLLVDSATGASYNANGVRGRKYLLPALFNPSTAKCSTLV